MRSTKTGVSASVDVLEPRVQPSTTAPLLSQHALSEVVRDVRAIMSTLARTENTLQASGRLTRLSARIPSGPQELAPSWRSDLGLYHPHSARSVLTTERQILGDLYRYGHGGGNGGNPPVTGSGSTPTPTPGQGMGGTTAGSGSTTYSPPAQGTGGTTTPVPAPSLDSVRIENTTGLALVVTIHLNVPQNLQRVITETIPAQQGSIVLFNFGTATNAFMTMDVSRANAVQIPPPWTNISLSQPLTGYNGALFTISLFGPNFDVSAS